MLRSDRPTRATLRPASCAASAIDSMRATLLAKQVTATRPAQVADQRRQAAAYVLFAAGVALDHRIGRIADHGQHAFVAELGQRGLVRRRPEQRRRIEFPVAGVQNGTRRRVDHQRLRLGDGVRHADEAQRERR